SSFWSKREWPGSFMGRDSSCAHKFPRQGRPAPMARDEANDEDRKLRRLNMDGSSFLYDLFPKRAIVHRRPGKRKGPWSARREQKQPRRARSNTKETCKGIQSFVYVCALGD